MSFMWPFYAAGLLAVSLPILFHLIRRTPQSRVLFSSLMFLKPSPPRLTRRSRLDQLLLLLLRGLALSLLALAFARPFLRANTESAIGDAVGRRIAIVLDTSASMQRSGVWSRALAELDGVLDDLAASDRVALFTYDDSVTPLLRFEESDEAIAASRLSIVRSRAKGVSAGWGGSNLGLALTTAAEALAEAEVDENLADQLPTSAKIVLISDLQQGSNLKSLDAFAWPDEVNVEIHAVGPDGKNRSNAGISLLGTGVSLDDGVLRVRVVNAPEAAKEKFELAWDGDDAARAAAAETPVEVPSEAPPADAGAGPVDPAMDEPAAPATTAQATANRTPADPTAADTEPANQGSVGRESGDQEPVDQGPVNPGAEPAPAAAPHVEPRSQEVYVPEGQSRTVQMDRSDEQVTAWTRLKLTGDDDQFDNTLYIAPQRQQFSTVAYFGDDDPADAQGLLYYLNRVYPETPLRRVDVVVPQEGAPLAQPDQQEPRLVVVAHDDLSDERIEQIRDYLSGGGRVLVVLWTVDMADEMGRLLADDPLHPAAFPLEESPFGDDFRLLGEIDFTHPLFVVFADPRFSDFTKIHFWKHRVISTEALKDAHIVARFDNDDPALIEFHRGAGTLWVLASGWDPYDSQFSRSSKFVPLLSTMLTGAGWGLGGVQFTVGDRIELTGMVSGADALDVVGPDGTKYPLAKGATSFDQTQKPGLYTLHGGEEPIALAVNLAAGESQTARLEVEQLERRGVRLGAGLSAKEDADRRRQLRDVELENKQKLWRHLIVVALAALIGETWLAGRKSGISQQPEETR